MIRVFCLFCIFALLAAVVPAFAQTSTGEIDITVLDSSDATVPNARITIRGSETGEVTRELTSSAQGIATAPLLKPETYDLIVSAPGFTTLVRKGITLRVGDVLELRLKLAPGSTTESVTVTAEGPLIDEKTGTLAQVMEERQILQLPLNGRNYLDLARLAPGAIPSRGSRDQSFSAYGNTGLQNAFLLDGARNENYLRGLDNRARDIIRPPLDALSEFTVQTSNYSAEFGASAGGVVNAITKSGTNQVHGSAYDFLRNSTLDAADFFAPAGTKPLLVRNQYGASLGGPVVRNHAWLFGAYEGTHIRNEQTSISSVPTMAMRQGNFGSTSVFDPFSTSPNPGGSGFVRAQFPNNTIPQNRLDPLGAKLINLYPLPNLSGAAFNYVSNVPQLQTNYNGVLRGDVQVSNKDQMFVRFSRSHLTQAAAPALPLPAQTPVNRNVDAWGAGFGYTRTFGPTLVNEARFSWTRLTLSQDATQPLDEIIPGILDPAIHSGTPLFNISGLATIGAQPGCCGNSPLTKSSGVWDVSDNVSKMLGRHSLRAGAELQWIRPSTMSALGGRGSLGFNGVFTQDPQNRAKTGSAVADLLLGAANTLNTGTVAQNEERGRYSGFYFQDQWTVNRNLTLNLGVRYELFFPYIEVQNRMANFVLDRGDPLYGQLIVAGDKRRPRSLLDMDKNNWAPRVGFAYRIPGARDLVVRSSYGIFYAQDEGLGVTSRMTNNPPFFGYGGVALISDQLNPSTGFVLSSGALAPRPPAINPSSFVLNPSATSGLRSWPERYTTPYVQEWNLTIEKQLPWSTVIQASYVGNIGVHLWGQYEGNQPLTNGPGSPNTRRPLAQYTAASVSIFGPWDRSTYEGFSSKIEKRFSSGLSFLSSFTWGHAFDLGNPAIDLCDGCGNWDTPQNNYDLNAQRASADNGVPLRFVFSGVWDLPFGHGRRFAANSRAAPVIGGWQFTAIYQAQSGPPYTVLLSFDNANAGTQSRPDRACPGTLSNPTLQHWFDTSCFVAPAQYHFGNSGRNILRGPGVDNIDLGLHRVFAITERVSLDFRAEAFNAVNHPQFGVPAAIIGISGVGAITSTSLPNRQLQFALRLAW